MTRKFCLNNLKNKLIAILTIVLLICSASFGLIACNDEEKPNSVTDPNYSKTEVTTEITNPNFYTGTPNVDFSKLPIASPTGWSKASTDNSASASTVNSGVILTTDEAWSALLSNLYDDTDFLKYVRNVFDFTDEDVVKAIKAEKQNDSYSPTTQEKKEYITKTYLVNFVNPKTHEGAEDNAVYMLNNIASSTNYKLGTAQKVTSSSTVTMDKGDVYKISVWVKTANLTSFSGEDYGANIRLKNSLNSKAQSEIRINNIIANEWTEYAIYVKADSDYTCTFSLILGLGYGNGSSIVSDYVEGTVYFDDVKVEKVDAIPENVTVNNLDYGNSENIDVNLTNNACAYDMSLANSTNEYFNKSINTFNADKGYYTKSNTAGADGKPITSQTLNPNSKGEAKVVDGVTTITVDKASYTLPLSSHNFSLSSEKYLIVSFYYQNKLNKLGSTNFSINVLDKQGDEEVLRNSVASLSLTEDDEWSKGVLLFKNNFIGGKDRTFSLEFVVGPANVRTVETASDFATGYVQIKDMKIASGDINQEDEKLTALYNLFSSSAKATVALYAGYSADYTEEHNHNEYNIKTAYGNFGDIISNPTAPSEYLGVVADHVYVKNEIGSDTQTVTNTMTGKGNDQYNAGVINTAYAKSYTDKAIAEKLAYDEEEPAQMLMINNKTAGHYGFIGETYTVSANNYASAKLSIKVCDNAVAYVYIVDITDKTKNVLSMKDFEVNTDAVNGVAKGTKIDGDALTYTLKVTSDMMKDGWVDLSFFFGTGAQEKSFRVEIWNGARDGATETASQGYVFVKSVEVSSQDAFTEPSSWNNAFVTEGNPLYEAKKSSFTGKGTELYAFQRQLTDIQKQFNKEYPDQAISEYEVKYVWAKNPTTIYGILNSIDPEYVNPYDSIEDEEDTGCAADADPSSFWLGFSSIIIAVVLLFAMVTIIVKRIIAKRKANASDAKSHYKVESRIHRKPVVKKEVIKEELPEETTEVIEEPVEEETSEATEEQTLDEYVYGEVQSFGEETEANVEKPEEPTEQAEETETPKTEE